MLSFVVVFNPDCEIFLKITCCKCIVAFSCSFLNKIARYSVNEKHVHNVCEDFILSYSLAHPTLREGR